MYKHVDKIAKVLKALTSILIEPVLNNSITVESNKPYINTNNNIIDCANK